MFRDREHPLAGGGKRFHNDTLILERAEPSHLSTNLAHGRYSSFFPVLFSTNVLGQNSPIM